jgi:hypothetical protein
LLSLTTGIVDATSVSLFVGAALGAFMVLHGGLAPPLALAAATVLVFTLALARDEARREA